VSAARANARHNLVGTPLPAGNLARRNEEWAAGRADGRRAKPRSAAAREAAMALKIYGVARSRAFRTLWMDKELGLDYEHVKVDFATGETRTPAHLALNPNGHVPVIDDNGFVLWESMAIHHYLATNCGA